jgi:hypothetical protein
MAMVRAGLLKGAVITNAALEKFGYLSQDGIDSPSPEVYG